MKKIFILICILITLSGCEAITHKNEIKELKEIIKEKDIKISELELNIIELENNIKIIKNKLDNKEQELNKINNKKTTLQNNITCSRYKTSLENDLLSNQQLLELFYSNIENTCIATVIASTNSYSSSGVPEVGYLKIDNAITGVNIGLFDCNKNKQCYTEFQNELKKLK